MIDTTKTPRRKIRPSLFRNNESWKRTDRKKASDTIQEGRGESLSENGTNRTASVPSQGALNEREDDTLGSKKIDITSTRIWNVKIPPARKHTLSGKLISSLSSKLSFGLHKRTRRISLEIHRPISRQSSFHKLNEDPNNGESISAGFEIDASSHSSNHTALMLGLLAGKSSTSDLLSCNIEQKLMDDENVILRLLKPVSINNSPKNKMEKSKSQGNYSINDDSSSESDFSFHDDSNSVSTLGLYGADEIPDRREWVNQHTYNIDDVEMTLCARNMTEMIMKKHNRKVTRQIFFETASEAHSFFKLIMYFKQLHRERSQRVLAIQQEQMMMSLPQSILASLSPAPLTSISSSPSLDLLIEISSAWNLEKQNSLPEYSPHAYYTRHQTFVIIRLNNGKILHSTKPISNISNPIWTAKTDSLFLLSLLVNEDDFDEFIHHGGLQFHVMSRDINKAMSSLDHCIGVVIVPHTTIINSNGQRKIFPLASQSQHEDESSTAQLTLKFRKATKTDIQLMKSLNNGGEDIIHILEKSTETVLRYVSPDILSSSKSLIENPKMKKGDGTLLRLVLPGPDPDKPSETEYMTERTIQNHIYQPSKNWIEAGSGKLGFVFVEILYCKNLPFVKDADMQISNPNVFVSLVYGDGFVNSDIIPECKSPCWLPWSRRAFTFHIPHPSSNLNIGVISYNDDGRHQPIGRISVNMSGFRERTEYVLKYNLPLSDGTYQEKNTSEIAIRMRIEMNTRQMFWASLQAPPKAQIRVDRKVDFEILKFTTQEMYIPNQSRLNIVKSYMDELASYRNNLTNIRETIIAIILWRTNPNAKERSASCLPLHSIALFLVGIFVVENPQYIPSFFPGLLLFMMLSNFYTKEQGIQEWNLTPSYFQLCNLLLFGQIKPHSILESKRQDEALHYQNYNSDIFVLDSKKDISKTKDDDKSYIFADQSGNLSNQKQTLDSSKDNIYSSTLSEYDADLHTLIQIQNLLDKLCHVIRTIENVISWNECYYSFWFTSFLLFCTLFLGLVQIPWGWMIHWILRLIVWVIFGPWMWLVDKCFFHHNNYHELNEIPKKEFIEIELRKKTLRPSLSKKSLLFGVDDRKLKAQMDMEDDLKLKDFKDILFGCYVKEISLVQSDRQKHIPLSSSNATPCLDQARNVSSSSLTNSDGYIDLNTNKYEYSNFRVMGHQQIEVDMLPRLVLKDKRKTNLENTSSVFHSSLSDSQSDSEIVEFTQLSLHETNLYDSSYGAIVEEI